MRRQGSSGDLERRRCLAVRRLLEGYSTEDVATFLGVDVRSVRRWLALYRQHGWEGLTARGGAGRPPKLSPTQGKILLRWLASDATECGFATELWTSERLAQLVREEWDIVLHPRSLRRWLRQHGFTLQRPQRVPRERDPVQIARWLADDWPRIKKKRAGAGPTWS